MKKILYIVKSIDGGTGKFIEDLQSFNKQYSVRTLVLEKPSYRKPLGDYIFLSKGTSQKSEYFHFFTNLTSFIKDFFMIRRQIDIIRPTIILGVDVYVNIIILVNKFFSKRDYKAIITTHTFLSMVISQKTSVFQKNIIRFCVHSLYGFADKIIAVSQGVKSDLTVYFGITKPIEVIYNGVNLVRQIYKRNKEYKGIIISVGRLTQQKDFETLIYAFNDAQKSISPLELWIVGDGPLKRSLISLSQSLNIDTKIRFFGWKQKINTFLRRGDMFILSTKWEGFPYVLTEAMSQGLPIIATDSPHGIREMLDNGRYGKLVGMADFKGMSKEIVNLAKNKRVRIEYGNKSKYRSQRYSIQKMNESYSLVFRSLS
jgi:glycosyltransferase involved in cell wall biosynthesis